MSDSLKKYYLSRAKTLEFLDKLAAEKGGEQLTAFIPPQTDSITLKTMLDRVPASSQVTGEMHDVCLGSPTGAVVYWGGSYRHLIVPPFPIRDSVMLAEFAAEHLKTILTRDYIIGIVLIRLGRFGVGVAKGDKLISSKIGTGLVHGRHRQGGSSAHRFERHRDKQIETFFNRVCGYVREHFEPYVKSMDYLVYGGAWETVQLFVKYCPILSKMDKPALPPLSDTPEPKQDVLIKAVGRIYSSTVYEW